MKIKWLVIPLAVGALYGNAFAEEKSELKGSVLKSIPLKKAVKTVAPLFSGNFNVVGIGLSTGQKLEKHQTPTSAFLYIQSGSVIFTMAGKKVLLQVGDYFAIPAQEMHEVEANEDSRLILVK